jgi:type IV fimbrial biogenesis protein FimT
MNMESFADYKRNRIRGFTLVELMIAIAVGAIILVAALPSFSAVLHKNRISTATSQLYVSLNTARSEAIKRRESVSVCPSTDSSSCDTSDIDWSDGWLIFEDPDEDRLRQSGESIIRLVESLHSGIDIAVENNVESGVKFNPTGDAFGTFGEFRICHSNSNVSSKAIRVSATGRVESETRSRTDCNADS